MIADRVLKMNESATLAMASKSRELIASGIDIISLSLGEPDFDTPSLIKDAAKKAIDENYSHYTPVNGLLSLREAISKKFKRDNSLDYDVNQIVVSTGAKQSLANVVSAIVNPGDEVLLPTPYWVSYEAFVDMAEGQVKEIKTNIDTDFKLTPALLEESISDKSKLLIFSSPCNPSGSVYSEEELKALAVVIARYPNLYVVSDEIYEHINFATHHYSIGTIEEISDRVITVNGVSKGFAMTGWRVGFIGASKEIASACTKLQGQVTSATCSIAQKAAEKAMEFEKSELKEMLDVYLRRRDLFLNELKQIDGLILNVPNGAFYIFPDVTSFFGKKTDKGEVINNADDLAMYLLNDANVATVSGGAFGNPNNIRLSYATSDDILIEAANRMKKSLNKLI